MNNKTYKTKEEIFKRAQEAIGIPLKNIDKTNRLSTGKGAIGSVLEESWFNYKPNSDSNPDFTEAGIELKATPYTRTKSGIRAKERLVCNIINYMDEYKHDFYDSSFMRKCANILLMSYEHKMNVPKGEFSIDKVTLFSFPEEDLLIIKNDWNTIVDKIKAGKAHEISEGDTLYLGACTKGKNSQSTREQPFSDIPAKQRAFSLKQSYMTYILNNYIFGNQTDEKVIKSLDDLNSNSFENIITAKIKPFLGMSQMELCNRFKLQSNAKNINELLVSKMLNLRGHISQTEEFKKANIVPKTIRVNNDGSITEHMSFPIFKFKEIINENWETSSFKTLLEQTKFLFLVFKYNAKNELIFNDILFWNMPEDDLDEVRIVWEKTVSIIKEGIQIRKSNGRNYNNLPKSTESRIAHVRPHARNSSDTLELPDGRQFPKQCFWLNNNYIKEQLEKIK